eukprot:CAMPEP_0115019668 /NCGR_PEP_ID=MMETSP0216-20121206/29598_1 /TAXON_ID=223996 /ORGANISM="Protocruzia adherens, Strain Boccale" /LENGTH=1033 /DNA_ID=CAMNT_0002391217 /DNA_START=47 /DNA_END=3151 /DNA_ORIENTATION=-
MATVQLSSASGLLSFFQEDSYELKAHALVKLDQVVDIFWPEISDFLQDIEALFEDEKFPDKSLAAFVASKVYYHLEEYPDALRLALESGDESKVYYHLEEYPDALRLALESGDRFNVLERSQYVETIISKCIDEYISLRVHNYENPDDQKEIDGKLESIVEKMFERCFQEGEYGMAIGISVECRRLDSLERAIKASPNIYEMLNYCYKIARSAVRTKSFRQEVLRTIVKIYLEEKMVMNYPNICQCEFLLNEPKAVADILDELTRKDEQSTLISYQIALDLYDNQHQKFLNSVMQHLPPESEESAEEEKKRLRNLKDILKGTIPNEVFLFFSINNDKSDPLIIKNIKNSLDQKNSTTHSACITANALMRCGTCNDKFLRDNIDWVGKATNWAKFSATASLGVIHKRNITKALDLLAPYYSPTSGQVASAYAEGGAYYAMGFIHSNSNDHTTLEFLNNGLRNAATQTNSEVIQHGSCLGLGMVAMGSCDEAIYEELKAVLYADSAVSGEAAAYAIGLVMLGSANAAVIEELTKYAQETETGFRNAAVIEELTKYAQETEHEKIIRGIAIALALVMYECEEKADGLINQLLLENDPLMRYGAMYTIALAYAGTESNASIRRLLHFAVSDVSDDVRKAAVIAIGFVLLRNPEKTPKIVALLSESYNPHVRYGVTMAVGISCAGTGYDEAVKLLEFNPHVRYGVTMAVGISCAGTGYDEAVKLLEPMMQDRVDFVRQGAMLGLSMVLIQTNKNRNSAVETLRKQLEKACSDQHEELLTKFGAILASGILDAGGRNCTISMTSENKTNRMASVIGMAMFTQYWYWYPLVNWISMSFSPTALVGINGDLKVPKSFQVTSNVKPSLFAYPELLKEEKKENKTKGPAVTLSTTNKAKLRAAAKKGDTDVEMKQKEETKKEEEEKQKAEEEEKKKKEEEAKKKDEATSEVLVNPSRVLLAQRRYITVSSDSRYKEILSRQQGLGGIIILDDTKSSESDEYITGFGRDNAAMKTATQPAATTASGDKKDEFDMDAPEEFELPG